MIKASNLKIDFKKNSSKQSLKKNEINILFLNNLNEIKFKPIWLNNEIEKFLIDNSKVRKIKKPYLFETQFGLFLIIPFLDRSDDYSLELSSPGIDRPLTRIKDFYNNKGNKIKITTVNLENEKKGEILAFYYKLNDNHLKIVNYFDNYEIYLSKTPLKSFTKNIINHKF